MSGIEQILDFWFNDPQAPPGTRKVWFAKDPKFDQLIRSRFQNDYHAAAAGQLDQWQESPQGCVALILLLDQFPRNMFRDTPTAFDTDPQALAVTERAIKRGFDQKLPSLQRWFLYIPLMHSENLNHQNQSVQLFAQLRDQNPETASAFSYAVRHQEVIERFGRFPHRNKILGRASTLEEVEFLKQPGSSF